MTQEEIEELEILKNHYDNYEGLSSGSINPYTHEFPDESRRRCYLEGKKEEHDKVQEALEIVHKLDNVIFKYIDDCARCSKIDEVVEIVNYYDPYSYQDVNDVFDGFVEMREKILEKINS